MPWMKSVPKSSGYGIFANDSSADDPCHLPCGIQCLDLIMGQDPTDMQLAVSIDHCGFQSRHFTYLGKALALSLQLPYLIVPSDRHPMSFISHLQNVLQYCIIGLILCWIGISQQGLLPVKHRLDYVYHGVFQVFDQMKAVGYLYHIGKGFPDELCIGTTSIPADGPDFPMLFEPLHYFLSIA